MISWTSDVSYSFGLSILSAIVFSVPTLAQTPNPEDWFCGRWWSQSVVKNDVLYIDSGIQKWLDPNVTWRWNGSVVPSTLGTSNWISTVSLRSTWDWKTNIMVNEEPKNVSSPSTGTTPPSLIRGHMFHGPENTTGVHVFGGSTYMGNMNWSAYVQPDANTYPLWTFDNGTENSYPWQQHDISQPWLVNHGSAAEAIDQGLGFYLNGQVDRGTAWSTVGRMADGLYLPTPGMVVIDLYGFTSTNISTADIRGNTPRVGGGMEYFAPIGGMGVLVALGGQIQPGRTEAFANETEGELLDFSAVDVFDIDSYLKDSSTNGTWYQQNTTGDIPAARIDFCTVSISAPDNSSHHIYLYGGRDPTKDITYDDIYVLSLPSFQWVPIFTNGESPRWGHNCHVAGRRQMLTVGGNVTNLQCDWEVKGVAIYDLSTGNWGSVFQTNTTAFTVPQRVLPATGGTTDGAATIREPSGGWTNPDLKTIFDTPRKWGSDQTIRGNGKGSETNTGAIAGGVVGGLAGLVLIGSTLFFWRRRRAAKSHELEDTERQLELNGEKKHYELQGVNENDPAELAGPEAQELNAPRELVEADYHTATDRAELPGTNIAQGGLSGVPIVRTPGDDLPEQPLYRPGLVRPQSPSTLSQHEVEQKPPTEVEARQDDRSLINVDISRENTLPGVNPLTNPPPPETHSR